MKNVHIKSRNTLAINLHTKFHMPFSNISLVTATKLTEEYRFLAGVIVFYITQTRSH